MKVFLNSKATSVLGVQVNADFQEQMVHKSSLYHKVWILHHFVVINKCQTRTSYKLEKYMYSVVLLCSMYGNLYRTKTAFIFCFHLKKTAAESYRLLRETNGEHVPSQITCERLFRRLKSGDIDTRQEGKRGT